MISECNLFNIHEENLVVIDLSQGTKHHIEFYMNDNEAVRDKHKY